MDLFKKANAWLQKTRTAYAASPVTYQRASSSASLSATVGRTQQEFTDGEGYVVQFNSRDFIVNVADLEMDGVLTQPAVGDRIVLGDLDDGTEEFEVMVNPASAKCWAWADDYHTTYRIHTKKVGTLPQQR